MIYMSDLTVGEMEENKQFSNELKLAICRHRGELTLAETCEGKIVIKSVQDKKSIYVCFFEETKKVAEIKPQKKKRKTIHKKERKKQ